MMGICSDVKRTANTKENVVFVVFLVKYLKFYDELLTWIMLFFSLQVLNLIRLQASVCVLSLLLCYNCCFCVFCLLTSDYWVLLSLFAAACLLLIEFHFPSPTQRDPLWWALSCLPQLLILFAYIQVSVSKLLKLVASFSGLFSTFVLPMGLLLWFFGERYSIVLSGCYGSYWYISFYVSLEGENMERKRTKL